MYCDHCQREVSTARNPHTGTIHCSQCGTEKGVEQATTSDSIAQTAQALLKRWEESRGQSSPVTQAAPAAEAVSAPTREHVSAPKFATSDRPAGDSTPSPPQVTRSVESAVRAANQEYVAENPAPERFQERQNTSGGFRDSTPLVNKQQITSPVVSSAVPPSGPAAASRLEFRPSETAAPPRSSELTAGVSGTAATGSYKDALLKSLTTQNDSEPLMPAAESIVPAASRKSAPVVDRESPPAARSVPQRHGVQFSGPPVNINDFEIQQAIVENQRRPRNWSALLGQFLAFSGGLAMTAGLAIVIGHRYGTLEIAETTGWLAVIGGHLLFILGLYTHLTSRIEQTWSDLHQRSDDLQRLVQVLQKSREVPPNFRSEGQVNRLQQVAGPGHELYSRSLENANS